MAVANLFEVRFQVVNAPGSGNQAYRYRREPRKALVQAASIHPKDLLAVLNADISLLSGETIEILGASAVTNGTEGQQVLT